MQHSMNKYLYDIKEAIESIEEYLGNRRDFSDYQRDKLLRRGIERELEIIGEATNRVLKMNPEIKISEARRIVDLRNWIIHGYDKVDDFIIWGIISRDVPKLKKQVEELLADG
ncbi:MAG: hypothetical protein BRD50_08730 [Bacteroidetes bacterium SW_11_45_7]|nr:MAG: hypothetical protein BRD50_08730 [Bacteroidetes bacterium SW_11_45_7]